MKRDWIFVDVESNGLDHDKHQAVEVAWWNLDKGDAGLFVPRHDMHKILFESDLGSMKINRYVDRIPGQEQDNERGSAVYDLWRTFAGLAPLDGKFPPIEIRMPGTEPSPEPVKRALVASNPDFDSRMLRKLFRETTSTKQLARHGDPWHYKMIDLGAYAMGVLGLDYPPGQSEVCERLGIDMGDQHSAMADVQAGGLCMLKLRTLREMIAARTPVGPDLIEEVMA
jgi:hypothetical protein